MKHKRNIVIEKPISFGTSTRNAVETAIDLAKDGKRWDARSEISPWEDSPDRKTCSGEVFESQLA